MKNKRNAQNKTKQEKSFELFFLVSVPLRINQKIQYYMRKRLHVAWRDQLSWLALMFSVRLFIKCQFGGSDGKFNENIDQRAKMRATKKTSSA